MALDLAEQTTKILGVKVTSTPYAGLLRRIRANIRSKTRFYVVTPNPEIVAAAQKDEALKKALNQADIALPDGVGIVAASRFLELAVPKNKLLRLPVLFIQGLLVGLATFFHLSWLSSELKVIKGREMFLALIKIANKLGWKVFFLGGRFRTCQKAVDELEKNYKKVKIESADGPELNQEALPISPVEKRVEDEIVKKINQFQPQLLFVGFGAPKQEKWLYRWLSKLDIGGAMVVGGTFDYISGRTRLPPPWIEKVGMEWLWRLLTGSQSLKRVLTALVLFPLKVFCYKSKLFESF